MSDHGSVSLWIERLKAGDVHAAQPLWERYYRRMVGLARKKLGDFPRSVVDEDDVVQSAFKSFYQRAKEGRFPDLSDRDQLWALLSLITARKAANLLIQQRRAKRGGTRTVGARRGNSQVDPDLAQIIGQEPTPEFAAQIVEQLSQLFRRVDDPTQRLIMLWKLEGWTNSEIAGHLDCSLSAVERKLRYIRNMLESSLSSELSPD